MSIVRIGDSSRSMQYDFPQAGAHWYVGTLQGGGVHADNSGLNARDAMPKKTDASGADAIDGCVAPPDLPRVWGGVNACARVSACLDVGCAGVPSTVSRGLPRPPRGSLSGTLLRARSFPAASDRRSSCDLQLFPITDHPDCLSFALCVLCVCARARAANHWVASTTMSLSTQAMAHDAKSTRADGRKMRCVCCLCGVRLCAVCGVAWRGESISAPQTTAPFVL
jgi:hypothetical protein